MKKLYLFNLEINLDSTVLAASHDWAESFSRLYPEIQIVTTHLGRTLLPLNASLFEIGGGNFWKKLRAISRLFRILREIWIQRKDVVVMHHMSTYSAVLIGPFIRMFGIKQGLWYSHSVASLTFRASTYIVDFLFSSSPETLPSNSNKARFFGHGIKVDRFLVDNLKSGSRFGVVTIGRYAKVKNFDKLLEIANDFESLRFDVYGPSGDGDYKFELSGRFAIHPNINLFESVTYEEIPSILSNYEYFYSGTPKSVDKAAIEAALAGCFIISLNQTTLKVTGMSEVWTKLNVEIPSSIPDQITQLNSFKGDKEKLRLLLQKTAADKNSVDTLTEMIAKTLAGSNEALNEYS